MERHFTATAYILHQNRTLLHFHAKLKKWLPPGGHLEPNETPPEAAKREAKEETGLDIQLIDENPFQFKAAHASSFERPFLCLLEKIPAHLNTPAHEHIDLIYLATPLEETQIAQIPPEFQWFSSSDLPKIKEELFSDTFAVLTKILT
jgi:8-oxo-dGTP pyrophosphatase MutT (NUDIX family)